MMEKLTQEMADKAWAIIEEVEAMGGMTQAVDSGWAKLKIEAAAAEKQARIDSGKDVIVGVNKYKLAQEDPVDILEVDNVKVRESQIARLQNLKQNAMQPRCSKCWMLSLTQRRPARAICWIWLLRPFACALPWVKCRMRSKKFLAATVRIPRR